MSEQVLTAEKLLQVMAKLPPREGVAVRDSLGRVVLELPFDRIAGAVVGGLVEWDEGSSAFYLTSIAEHELRARGAFDA